MRSTKTSIIVAAIALAAAGFLSGWLIGASESPVVAAFFTPFFALLGGFSLKHFDERRRREDLQRTLEASKQILGEDAIARIVRREAQTPKGVPLAWSLGILAFCLANYAGLQRGIEARLPSHHETLDLIETVPDKKLTSEVEATLIRTLADLQKSGFDETETRKIFDSILIPAASPAGGGVAKIEELSRRLRGVPEPTLGHGKSDAHLIEVLKNKDLKSTPKALLFQAHWMLIARRTPPEVLDELYREYINPEVTAALEEASPMETEARIASLARALTVRLPNGPQRPGIDAENETETPIIPMTEILWDGLKDWSARERVYLLRLRHELRLAGYGESDSQEFIQSTLVPLRRLYTDEEKRITAVRSVIDECTARFRELRPCALTGRPAKTADANREGAVLAGVALPDLPLPAEAESTRSDRDGKWDRPSHGGGGISVQGENGTEAGKER